MNGYALLDSGQGRKLEQVGPYLLDRQAPQAVWMKRVAKADWQRAVAVHIRDEKGGGHWKATRALPETWSIEIQGLQVHVKPTPFGHLGFFAEQAAQWQWIAETVRARLARGQPARILNLFAYTGLASLSAAKAGAEVCHVDAAKGIVDWARTNAELNGLSDRPIRWIVEDALRFAQREVQRGRRYDGIILDPPSYGRGAKQEVWRIEDDLPPLLQELHKLWSEDPAFVLLSGHTQGWTETVLSHLIADAFGKDLRFDGGEMLIPCATGRALPSGHYLRALPAT